jgi:formylglycine-generating enzyme required for sulfatase activity
MGQGGNVREWNESAFDGSNNTSSEARTIRGGVWLSTEEFLRSSTRLDGSVSGEVNSLGFRVASVPEPSTYALLAMTAAGALWMTRRRR